MALYDYKGNDLTKKLITGKMSYEDWEKLITRQMEEAIDKKAEAQKKMGEASIIEMYFNAMPQIVANAAAPLTNVDKIVQYGDGNSARLVKDVMGSANQVIEAMSENGIDIKEMLTKALNK